jgi:Protein kinase domain
VMLVSEDDEDDVVKLLDFGIAQIRTSSKLTSAGQFLGTPHYMAPEQFAGLPVDARADLYALGVMLFEALTGTLPFDATSIVGLARAHTSTPAPKLSERRAEHDLDPRLEQIVDRLLAKSPDARFATARAVLDALKEVGTTAPAPRPSRSSLAPSAAGPAVPRDAVEVVWSAIQVGTSLYNAGDHAGCVRVYREAAEAILARKPRPAVAARLRAALGRAKELHETQAAWEIRFAFDDLLHGSVVTIVPAPGDEVLEMEIAAAQAIASSRYAENDLDAVGAFYLELARTLEGWLREEGREPGTADWLARVADRAARAGGGQRGLAGLSEALESVRKTRLGTVAAASAVRSAAVASARSSLAGSDCPRIDEIARRLVNAISVGAPAYNSGDIVGCLRLYRQTAESLVTELASEPACGAATTRLRTALDQSKSEDADRAAWTMRKAFDELLEAATGR